MKIFYLILFSYLFTSSALAQPPTEQALSVNEKNAVASANLMGKLMFMRMTASCGEPDKDGRPTEQFADDQCGKAISELLQMHQTFQNACQKSYVESACTQIVNYGAALNQYKVIHETMKDDNATPSSPEVKVD